LGSIRAALLDVGFEVSTEVKIHVKAFWTVMPCNDAIRYQSFRGPCWKWRQQVLQDVGILPQHYMVSQPFTWSNLNWRTYTEYTALNQVQHALL